MRQKPRGRNTTRDVTAERLVLSVDFHCKGRGYIYLVSLSEIILLDTGGGQKNDGQVASLLDTCVNPPSSKLCLH